MSKKQKVEVVLYYMSLHYGIATAVDSILSILVNEKEAWAGEISDYTELDINKPNLFGGNKKEGGLDGKATYLPGGAGQVLPDFLAKRFNLTGATSPAYRGVSSIFFTGRSEGKGFYWSANQPTIPGTWIVARRSPKGLSPGLAMMADKDGKLSIANPSHIIYEVLTNDDWGIGAPSSSIDVPSMEYAAQILFNEKFGISILWTEAQSAEDFISNILTYVDGCMFVNPRTGLLTLKLVRGDYVLADQPLLTPDNSTMDNFQRKLWGETINEIVVSWTNPESEETETVSIQDLANIAIQGGVVSDQNEYVGIRDKDLAMTVAARDLRVASSPMASCTMYVNREGWDVTPGGVVRVTWPKHGMTEVAMRVGNVDYGKITDSKIQIALIEDVFSLDPSAFSSPPSTGWSNPRESPLPLQYCLIWTLPYYFAKNNADDMFATLAQPDVIAGVLGAQSGQDTNEFILGHSATDTLGNLVVEYGSDLSTISHGQIGAALPFAVRSTVNINNVTQGDGLVAGYFAILGSNDLNMEICLIESVTGSTVTLRRGCFDTVPRAWPVNAGIFIMPPDAVIADDEVHAEGETVVLRPLPVTSKDTLQYAAATNVTGQMTARPWAPSRPANVKANGIASGAIIVGSAVSTAFTWNNRNRLAEDTIILDWDDATVAPEDGQTTSLVMTDPADGSVITRIDGLTGTSYTLLTSAIPVSVVNVSVIAVRDGIDSVQGHTFELHTLLGYGKGYGLSYGKL